jgi:thiosulfate dehydrogenase [quinone] large subunit
MSTMSKSGRTRRSGNIVEDSPIARSLFGDVRWSWLWLIIRLYMGWQWIQAGWEKLHSATWVGSKAGTAMTGFIQGALSQTSGAHPNVQAWYAWFLQHWVLPNVSGWSYLIAWGEFLVGVALVLGIFTGIAAFFGSVMNVNYLLAGAVSTNPVLFIFATWIVLAWKTAGWIGLDHWILPALGTPWSPGRVLRGVVEGQRESDQTPTDHPSHA